MDPVLKKKEDSALNYEPIVKKINTVLTQEKKIEAAYLLGSAAQGRMHPKSDIDLAILPHPPKSYSTIERLALAARLQDVLPYEIDIGILGTHDVIYAFQAIVKGRCIFFRDRFKKDLFAATCLALYTELKRQRIEVEHAYRS